MIMIRNTVITITGAAALCVSLVMTGCRNKTAVSPDLLSAIHSRGEMIVAMEGTWAPWTYHDEKGKLTGFDVEVAELIAQKLGVKAVFAEGEWSGLFAGLDSGRYDAVVNGVEITDERSEKYDFSDPYGFIRTALIVRSDNSSIASFADLKGKKTANSISSTYMMLAESCGAETAGVETLDQTMDLVIAGRVDATLNADVSYADYKRVHPDAPLKVAALTENASSIAIPVRKGASTENFRAAVNKAIAELRAEGKLAGLSRKYFGCDIS